MPTKPTPKTTPVSNEAWAADNQTVVAPHLSTADGAEYVHTDLVRVVEPWAVEKHIRPISDKRDFGTIGSWAEYVKRYSKENRTLLTWSERGFAAVLDYHNDETSAPNRCQWVANMPFVYTVEWNAWGNLCSGARDQRSVIEFIEDHAEDVVDPDAAKLATMLRALRATVNSQAVTELNPDGSTHVNFSQSRTIKGNAAMKVDALELPATFKIAIPVLKGHVDEKGKAVRYAMEVRMRPSVDDDSHVVFRFTIPKADQVKEDVLQEQVADAQTRLTGHALYRSA